MRTDPALERFVEDRYATVVGMLTLYVGQRHVAEELAQDALVKLVRHWDEVAAMDNPEGWLTTVAFNTARSWWRRRYAEQRARRRHGASDSVDVAPDTSTAVVVREAVGDLPPRQRQVVVLRYFVGCSVAETAEVMGCAEGTVKSLSSRARQALRRRDLGIPDVDVRRPGHGHRGTTGSPRRRLDGPVADDTDQTGHGSTRPGADQ
ncbi:RNA polymerase sigma factor [Salsipaludibacter albus]|uniref:RNA polymerase sigma factor n=1 Tax=Salsipaludibacter albus TaxID=2849650 RepID=UPI001EE45A61|nr:SigE family RNA polymerase sigma factor [Salsipaludibacter albus]MBY5163705.1 SigE family RNA polymerase sigma factor [Salsipaludibacter albus]